MYLLTYLPRNTPVSLPTANPDYVYAMYIIMHCLRHITIYFFIARAMLARYAVIVCPSVRPYVTGRSCTKMAKPRITQTTPYDRSGTLAF